MQHTGSPAPHMNSGGISQRCMRTRIFPFDQAWGPSATSIAPQLFALSLFPYLGFLYHLTRSGKIVPRLTLFGFYFLLAFVGATIPAGIYGEPLSHCCACIPGSCHVSLILKLLS